jgi:hypothetical protein
MKTELICIGSLETIARVWHGLFESGRLIMMRMQDEGEKKIAVFEVLSEYAEVLS